MRLNKNALERTALNRTGDTLAFMEQIADQIELKAEEMEKVDQMATMAKKNPYGSLILGLI